MNYRRLLGRLLAGDVQNVRFNDFVNLLYRFDFEQVRQEGSHRIFKHPLINQRLNLQNVNGKAVAYQIRQFLRLVERENLTLRYE